MGCCFARVVIAFLCILSFGSQLFAEHPRLNKRRQATPEYCPPSTSLPQTPAGTGNVAPKTDAANAVPSNGGTNSPQSSPGDRVPDSNSSESGASTAPITPTVPAAPDINDTQGARAAQASNNNRGLYTNQLASDSGANTFNTIGDFFGGVNSVADIKLSVGTTFFTSIPGADFYDFNNSAELASGRVFNGSFGAQLVSLQDFGDILSDGQTFFIDQTALSPGIGSILVGSTASQATIDSVLLNGGGNVSAQTPLSRDEIVTRIRNGIADNAPEFTGNYENIERYLQVSLSPHSSLSIVDNGGQIRVTPNYIYDLSIALPTPSPGDLVGRVSLSDNNSPLPRDRIFYDFNYFHNAVIGPATIPMNRFTPGFEKTFLEKNASIEVRVPMAVTLTSDVNTASGDVIDSEMGDALFALKGLLYSDNRQTYTAGLGVTVPTAQDFNVRLGNGTQVLQIRNQTLRLQPYFAAMLTPDPFNIFQMFGSVNVDVSGNPIYYNSIGLRNGTGGTLDLQGRAQASTLGKLDLTYGRWLFKGSPGYVKAMAFAQELHMTGDLSSPDRITTDNLKFGALRQSFIANSTTGLHTYIGKTNFTVGYGTPLTSQRGFDGELRVFVNRYF